MTWGKNGKCFTLKKQSESDCVVLYMYIANDEQQQKSISSHIYLIRKSQLVSAKLINKQGEGKNKTKS